MTSEIALLNKSAVALAADSATTVTYWERGERKRRYFKGANKIFNLSIAHPVGLMTYAAASLQGVPWEILAKAYRAHIGMKAHDHLHAYADDFFEYIKNNNYLYPPALQDKQFLSQVDRTAVIVGLSAARDDAYKAEKDPSAKQAIYLEKLRTTKEEIDGAAFIQGAVQADIDDAIAKFGVDSKKMMEEDSFYKENIPDAHHPSVSCYDGLTLGVMQRF
jgi:hypothetical protein